MKATGDGPGEARLRAADVSDAMTRDREGCTRASVSRLRRSTPAALVRIPPNIDLVDGRPTRHPRTALEFLREHLPRDAAAEHEQNAGQTRAIRNPRISICRPAATRRCVTRVRTVSLPDTRANAETRAMGRRAQGHNQASARPVVKPERPMMPNATPVFVQHAEY